MNDEPKLLIFLPVRLAAGARLPTRAHDSDAGLDLFSTEPFALRPGEIRCVPTGVHVAIPAGYCGQIVGRSGLAMLGVTPLGGCIDAFYTGEIGVILTNLGSHLREFDPVLAIAQLVIYPVATPTPFAVDVLPPTERGSGSYGSTDRR